MDTHLESHRCVLTSHLRALCVPEGAPVRIMSHSTPRGL